MRRSAVALFLSLSFISVNFAVPEDGQYEIQVSKGAICDICGMYIAEFRHTACEVTFDNQKTRDYCGVSCALRAINEHLGLDHVKAAYATDWDTQKTVPLKDARLVIGSDIIPDMIPNLMAFKTDAGAEAYLKKHGGRNIKLEEALASISYYGLTVPFRITPAATPPARVLTIGVSGSRMVSDNILQGNTEKDANEVLKSRKVVPTKMEGNAALLAAAYSFTDDLALQMGMPYMWKSMKCLTRTGEQSYYEEGNGDILNDLRYRFYHDENFDQHLAADFKLSIPSGHFSEANRARPAMQLGTGAFGTGGGLLFSQHLGLFWLHASLEYFYPFENNSDYRFGEQTKGGFALHFTPSTKTMVGLEFDYTVIAKNQDNGKAVSNTGRETATGNAVMEQRLAYFWGGNFNFRGLFGLPIYEHVEDIQLGESYHFAGAFQWKRRY